MTEQKTALDDLIDEVAAEPSPVDAPPDDGSYLITLTTERGSAPIRVPPIKKWRSSARNALFTRGDDAAWAVVTLTPEDAVQWMELDPTGEDTEAFIGEFYQLAGQVALGEASASRRSSTGTRGR